MARTIQGKGPVNLLYVNLSQCIALDCLDQFGQLKDQWTRKALYGFYTTLPSSLR